jgi:hypothetical protein
MMMTSNERQSQNIKIGIYQLPCIGLDHTQILNLSLDDKTIFYTYLK